MEKIKRRDAILTCIRIGCICIFGIAILIILYYYMVDSEILLSDCNIKEETSIETNKLLHIDIKDTYTVNDEKHYIIKIENDFDEYDMSEDEYNKYIGKGNNAVYSDIYYLRLSSDVATFSGVNNKYDICHNFFDKQVNLSGIAAMYENDSNIHINNYTNYYNSIKIADAFGQSNFESFCIKGESSTNLWERQKNKIKTTMCVQRYSFMDEKEFSDNDIKAYSELMQKIDKDLQDKIS